MGQCTSKQQAAAAVASTGKGGSLPLSSTSTSDNLSVAEARKCAGRASNTVHTSLKDGSAKEMAASSKSGSASCRSSERKHRSMKDTSSNELTESVKSTSTQRRSRKGSSRKCTSMKGASSNELRESSTTSMKDTSSNELTESVMSTSTQRRSRKGSSRKCTSMKDVSSNELRESSKSASPSSKQKRGLSIDNIEKVAEALSTPDKPERSLSIVAPAPKSRGRSMRTLPSKKVNKNQSDTSPPPLGKMPGAPTGARTSITICEVGKPTKRSLFATKESSWFKLSCSNSMNGSNLYDSYKHGDSQSSMQSSCATATIMEGGNSNAPVAGALSRNNKNALSSMVGICFTDSDGEDDEDDEDVSDSDDAKDIEDDMPRIREIVPTSELILQDVQESDLPASWAH